MDGVVAIAIQDGQPELRRPVIADAGYLAEHGRGLHTVAAICHDWGITTASNGKVVWFNLRLPDRAGRDADILSLGAAPHEASKRRAVVPFPSSLFTTGPQVDAR